MAASRSPRSACAASSSTRARSRSRRASCRRMLTASSAARATLYFSVSTSARRSRRATSRRTLRACASQVVDGRATRRAAAGTSAAASRSERSRRSRNELAASTAARCPCPLPVVPSPTIVEEVYRNISPALYAAREGESLPGNFTIERQNVYNLSSNVAGWSSPVARRAHNPKVAGSNPAPATITFLGARSGAFLVARCPSGCARCLRGPRGRNRDASGNHRLDSRKTLTWWWSR